MDKNELQKIINMMSSENDSDAVMGLRALQGAFVKEGVDVALAMDFVFENLDKLKRDSVSFDQATTMPAAAPKKDVAITVSGMPQCWSPQAGSIEIIPSGEDHGEIVPLPGTSANDSEVIAMNLKDALVAAAINKSKMKLKMKDVKNNKGEIIETILQAEYDRDGMTPIQVWVNVRGEVASLAAVLRKAVSNSWPDLVAA